MEKIEMAAAVICVAGLALVFLGLFGLIIWITIEGIRDTRALEKKFRERDRERTVGFKIDEIHRR